MLEIEDFPVQKEARALKGISNWLIFLCFSQLIIISYPFYVDDQGKKDYPVKKAIKERKDKSVYREQLGQEVIKNDKCFSLEFC